MIDTFVFLPFAREKEKDGKTDIDVGSQNDQEIDLCVWRGVFAHTRTQVGLSSLYLCSLNKQMVAVGWLIIRTAGWW